MQSMLRSRALSRRVLALALFLALIVSARPLAAQAWVPPAGSGSVTFLIQKIDNTGHFLTDGTRLDDGRSTNVGLYVEAEYAATDRFSVSVGLPYVFAKYVGPGPTPFNFLPVDECRCWQSGWQDVGLIVRYNLINGVFALTPSLSAGVPSHDYNYRGEAVVGRRLKEIRVGVDAGRRLDMISSRLAVQGRYSFAFVERVLDIPNNRSNIGVEANYTVSRKLSTRAVATWQRTHGGLRFPDDIISDEQLVQHDRLLRDNNFRVGGGASFSWPRVDVFGSYIAYVSGTDAHAGRVFTIGASWPFRMTRP
jgi:hypothetical protein